MTTFSDAPRASFEPRMETFGNWLREVFRTAQERRRRRSDQRMLERLGDQILRDIGMDPYRVRSRDPFRGFEYPR